MLASIDFLSTSNAKLVNIFVVKNCGNYKNQVHELKEQNFQQRYSKRLNINNSSS